MTKSNKYPYSKTMANVETFHSALKAQYILKHFKTTTLDSMPVSSRRLIDNEMNKCDQMACIRYKNQNVLA